jgi:lipopolysaccharide transport system ATP-binding protein
MGNDIVIDVKNISKKYDITVGYEPDNLREKIVDLIKYPIHALKGTHKTKKKVFWALKDISFQVRRGEVLGVIGRNGAGKSTLLKILSRITDPTAGEITMRGRVASLLEVGTGFNPELTGRENIYLNGSIIGMTRKEIDTKLNDIIEFSGVREFIDTPVKRYSSGMYVRLAFAVAVHLDSDILLLDEVLAVGDSSFQAKALKKITEIVLSGKTVIFVSHNMIAIREFCSRGLFLDKGNHMFSGDINSVINKYLAADHKMKGTRSFQVAAKYNDDESEWNINKPIQIIVSSPKKFSYSWECDIAAYSSNGTKVFAFESNKISKSLKKHNKMIFEFLNPGITTTLYVDVGIKNINNLDEYVELIPNAVTIKPNYTKLPNHKREDVIITIPCSIKRL